MELPSANYTDIIWDWNGTLLNDAWLCVDVMNGMLSERNLPQRTLDEYRTLFGFPVRSYYEKLGYDFEKESFDIVGLEFIVRYNQRHHESNLHPGALEVLEYLKSSGYRQYILSAREQKELLEEVKKQSIDHYFSQIQGIDDHYAHGKNEAGTRLIGRIGYQATRMLFIGDTLHDAEVAAELGIDCVLIPNGHYTRERLEAAGCPIADSLQTLIHYL